MAYIRLCITSLLVVFGVLVSNAQTSTPTPTNTPNPNALNIGYYEFENLTAPYINLTGTWSVVGSYNSTGLYSTGGSSLSFTVSQYAYYISIQQRVYTPFQSLSTWRLCVDTVCYTKYTRADVSQWQIINFSVNPNSVVTIDQIGIGGPLFLDFVEVHGQLPGGSGSNPTAVPTNTPTITPTPTQTPTATLAPYIYATIVGVSGSQLTRFEYVATAGDVAVFASLVFLFLSFWAIAIIYYLTRGNK